ncbi:DUF3099 domain-containing protein [Agromyces sp. G08B096]|uniref:DUF3099 domain-containing protein n=1 Tax=Agromyces sp. G08B096 TaxID=3156399 RepID=A0AAU7WBS0_9MICO
MNQHTITTLPPSPDAERRSRMIKYTIAMSIRVLCIFLMLFAQGWWLVVFAAGAIFLPYVAVVLANVGGGRGGAVERPGGLVPLQTGRAAPAEEPVGHSGADRGDRGPAAPTAGEPDAGEPTSGDRPTSGDDEDRA